MSSTKTRSSGFAGLLSPWYFTVKDASFDINSLAECFPAELLNKRAYFLQPSAIADWKRWEALIARIKILGVMTINEKSCILVETEAGNQHLEKSRLRTAFALESGFPTGWDLVSEKDSVMDSYRVTELTK